MFSTIRITIFSLVLALFASSSIAKVNFFNSDNSTSGASSDIYGDFLPPEQAFIYSVSNVNKQQVTLSWVVADGYYLYKKKFEFSTDSDIAVDKIAFPVGVEVDDPKFGLVEVFKGNVDIQLVFDKAVPEQGIILNFDYQGCAAGGLCYPLMQGDYPVLFDAELADFDAEAFAKTMPDTAIKSSTQNQSTNKLVETELSTAPEVSGVSEEVDLLSQEGILASLSGKSFAINIAVFFLAGIVAAFLGCSYPLIPIVSSILAGQGDKITPARGAALSAVYVVAMALVLSLAGIVAASIGINVTALLQNPFVLGGVSLVFILLAIAMFGKLEIAMPSKLVNALNDLSNKQKGGSYIGAGVMGALSALIAGPCATPVLAGALIYIAKTNDLFLGWTALFAMGIGTGVPLIIVGAGMGSFLPKAGDWMILLKSFFGFVLLGLALWFMQQGGLPLRIVHVGWGLIFGGAAVYFILNGMEYVQHKLPVVALSIVFAVISVSGFVAAGCGGKSVFAPLTQPVESNFSYVHNLDELQARIAGEKPVVLYLSAEWCTVCRSLEANVLPEPEVLKALQNWNPTKIDMTVTGEFQKVLMEKYQIVGPPTFIMLDKRGNVVDRVVGNIDAEALADKLR